MLVRSEDGLLFGVIGSAGFEFVMIFLRGNSELVPTPVSRRWLLESNVWLPGILGNQVRIADKWFLGR